MDLQGKKILVTRAKAQASALSLQIEKFGGVPIEMPLISCRAVQNPSKIQKVIVSLHTYQWLIFTSKNGVDFFFQQYRAETGNLSLPTNCKIAVVGKKTDDILATYGLRANLIPKEYVAESLLEALLNVVKKEDQVLIPHGNLARNVISEGLRKNGVQVTELVVYETVVEESSKESLYHAIKNKEIDVVTFTSSSTVENFIKLLEGTNWREYSDNLMFVSIGPITTKSMKENHLHVSTEAKEYTLQGMLESIIVKLKEEK